MKELRFAYAGDRDISVWVLDFLLERGYQPSVLMICDSPQASHGTALIERCPFLDESLILRGRQFRTEEGIHLLRSLDLDFLISVHFPYLVPESVLAIPKRGAINLHPAYLPYNRGWHTPTWTLLDNTPAGATLHFMVPEIDAGDIIHQKRLEASPADTAHSLYERLKLLELEVFQEAWGEVVNGNCRRRPQQLDMGTQHHRKELFSEDIQKIDLDQTVRAGDLLRKLRALTTSDIRESAYFEVDGRRYRVQISIQEDLPPQK